MVTELFLQVVPGRILSIIKQQIKTGHCDLLLLSNPLHTSVCYRNAFVEIVTSR